MVNPGNIDSFLHLALALFLPVSVFKFLHFPLFFSSFLFYLYLSLSVCLLIFFRLLVPSFPGVSSTITGLPYQFNIPILSPRRHRLK